jgi:hypothetical protein
MIMDEQLLIPLDYRLLSIDVIEVLINEPDVDESFFQELVNAHSENSQILTLLFKCPLAPAQIKDVIAQKLGLSARKREELEKTTESEKKLTLTQKVQRMGVGKKVQLALKGGREMRMLLIKDPSKEVKNMVLKNPRITEGEIEIIAANKNTPTDLLREIAKNKDWIKNYTIKTSLVYNPKTPIPYAINFVKTLNKKDLKNLSKSKAVPEPVRLIARKFMKEVEKN